MRPTTKDVVVTLLVAAVVVPYAGYLARGDVRAPAPAERRVHLESARSGTRT